MSQENNSSKQPLIRHVNRQQMSWRAIDVERLLSEDHPARAIWALVGCLDLSGLYRTIESNAEEGGRPAFDPQLLISLWVYAYSQGLGSAREVARRCEYDPAFQWLTGLEEVNYHTLADFRVEKQKELDELFTQVLAALSKERLITLEQVMQDGTKIKALASTGSYHHEGTIREHLERARQRVAEMGDPRRKQSENQKSAGARTARAARATGECAGRVAEVAGAQERRKSQEQNAGEHQRSAGTSDAPFRWGIIAELQRADFHGCREWIDCGGGGDADG
jgi:transposase